VPKNRDWEKDCAKKVIVREEAEAKKAGGREGGGKARESQLLKRKTLA